MSKPRRTKKQKEIMGIVLRAAGQGNFLDAHEIHRELSYGGTVSFGAVRKSLEVLEHTGMIARSRTGQVVTIIPTADAFNWYRPAREGNP